MTRKPIVLSRHAKSQLADRGATVREVQLTIREGEEAAAKQGRLAFRKNFQFEKHWKGVYYEGKQVQPIVVEEAERFVVVTVYVFYIGARR
ncbi:MAG: hypothetical protein HYZ90_02050 [Candidatus Omnitrophica bacterium]|nr:hypothetical protein [Candidatus Omnitrophota bacterium]